MSSPNFEIFLVFPIFLKSEVWSSSATRQATLIQSFFILEIKSRWVNPTYTKMLNCFIKLFLQLHVQFTLCVHGVEENTGLKWVNVLSSMKTPE